MERKYQPRYHEVPRIDWRKRLAQCDLECLEQEYHGVFPDRSERRKLKYSKVDLSEFR